MCSGRSQTCGAGKSLRPRSVIPGRSARVSTRRPRKWFGPCTVLHSRPWFQSTEPAVITTTHCSMVSAGGGHSAQLSVRVTMALSLSSFAALGSPHENAVCPTGTRYVSTVEPGLPCVCSCSLARRCAKPWSAIPSASALDSAGSSTSCWLCIFLWFRVPSTSAVLKKLCKAGSTPSADAAIITSQTQDGLGGAASLDAESFRQISKERIKYLVHAQDRDTIRRDTILLRANVDRITGNVPGQQMIHQMIITASPIMLPKG